MQKFQKQSSLAMYSLIVQTYLNKPAFMSLKEKTYTPYLLHITVIN